MAFSFGQSSAASLSTGASIFATSTPAIGVTSNPSFGAQQPFSFGGQASPSPFGAPSTSTPQVPLFQSARPAAFGAQSQAAFSFGKPSTPAFSFGGANTGTIFGSTTSAPFGTSQPAGLFGAAPQQQQQQSQQQFGGLTTLDGKPVSKSTKWEEMSPSCQQIFIDMQKIIDEQKNEMRLLETDARLNSQPEEMFASEIQALQNQLAGIANRLDVDNERVDIDRQEILSYHENLQIAARAFNRTRAWREASKLVHGQGQPIPVFWQEQLMLPVELPSPVLDNVVNRLMEDYVRLQRVLTDLERGQPKQIGPGAQAMLPPNEALKRTISNTWETVDYLAGQLAKLRDRVSDLQDVFLAQRRQAGDYSNPFAEAARRDQQRREAAEAARKAERRASTAAAAAPATGFATAQPGAAAAPLPTLALPAPATAATPGGVTLGSAATSLPTPTPLIGSAMTGGGLFSTPTGVALAPISTPAPTVGLAATPSPSLGAWNGAAASLPRNNSMRKGKTRK
eukprot:jgi/Botrbrau1/6928/Bobra.0215s0007.1